MKHYRVAHEKQLADRMGQHHLCLTRYIRKKLRCIHTDMTISTLAVYEMDHFLKDMLQMLGEAATDLLAVSGKCTIQPYTIAKATKLVLPSRLSKRIRLVAKQALFKYYDSFAS